MGFYFLLSFFFFLWFCCCCFVWFLFSFFSAIFPSLTDVSWRKFPRRPERSPFVLTNGRHRVSFLFFIFLKINNAFAKPLPQYFVARPGEGRFVLCPGSIPGRTEASPWRGRSSITPVTYLPQKCGLRIFVLGYFCLGFKRDGGGGGKREKKKKKNDDKKSYQSFGKAFGFEGINPEQGPAP